MWGNSSFYLRAPLSRGRRMSREGIRKREGWMVAGGRLADGIKEAG